MLVKNVVLALLSMLAYDAQEYLEVGMGVTVREWKGAWWLFSESQGETPG